MSSTDEPISPWAFRAALSGLAEGQAREILEGDRCPAPEARYDWEETTTVLPLDENEEDVIICRTDREGAWIQSSDRVSLPDAR